MGVDCNLPHNVEPFFWEIMAANEPKGKKYTSFSNHYGQICA